MKCPICKNEMEIINGDFFVKAGLPKGNYNFYYECKNCEGKDFGRYGYCRILTKSGKWYYFSNGEWYFLKDIEIKVKVKVLLV